MLRVRKVDFRKCGLVAEDVAQLLRCAEQLEVACFTSDRLNGIGEELRVRPPRCPHLGTLDVNDCSLEAEDVAAVLELIPVLASLSLQSMDLGGLRATAPLPKLVDLRALDCQLPLMDAWRLVGSCPNLRTVELCGNPLGGCDGEVAGSWPWLPQLQTANFMHCGLSEEEELAIQSRMPKDAVVLNQVSSSRPPARVVFASSSDSEVSDGADDG